MDPRAGREQYKSYDEEDRMSAGKSTFIKRADSKKTRDNK